MPPTPGTTGKLACFEAIAHYVSYMTQRKSDTSWDYLLRGSGNSDDAPKLARAGPGKSPGAAVPGKD